MSLSIHATASVLTSASSLHRADPDAPAVSSGKLASFDGDWCGTVPRKFPVPPPPLPLGDLMRDLLGAHARFGTQVGSEG